MTPGAAGRRAGCCRFTAVPRHVHSAAMRVVAILLPIVLAAGEAPPDLHAWHDDGAMLSMRVDGGWRARLLAARPLAAYAQPAAAAARAHVAAQVEALAAQRSEGEPPWIALLANAAGMAQLGWMPSRDRQGGGSDEPQLALLADVGAAAEAVRAWLVQEMGEHGEPAQIGDFGGYRVERVFVGTRGQAVAMGQVPRLQAALARVARGHEGGAGDRAIARLQMDLREFVARAAGIALQDPEWMRAGEALLQWRRWAPRIALALDAVDGELRTSAVLRGLADLPLRPADPELLAGARAGRTVTLAAGVEPLPLWELAAALAAYDGMPRASLDATLRAATGCTGTEIAAALTGDVLVQADWEAGALPSLAAALRLHDGDEAGRLLERFAAAARWQRVDAPAGAQAWTWASPIGLVRIERRGERCAVGTDIALVQALAASQDGDAALPAGRALLARVDLARLGRGWLPLVWGMIAGMREQLGDDPLASLASVRWQLAQELRRNAAPKLGECLLRRGGIARHALARIFPGEDTAAAIDAGLALYATEGQPAGRRADAGDVALVLRTAAGFVVIDDWDESRRAPVDAAELERRLAGRTRRSGPEPARLALGAMPERVVVDRRWLPPAETVAAQLPAYALDLVATADQLRIDERGLPAVGALLGGCGYALWLAAEELDDWERSAARRRSAEAARRRHAAPLAALAAAGRAVAALRAAGQAPPERPSGLVGKGLDLASCAGFFGGRVPPAAAALDQLGRWEASPDGWPQAVWAFKLEDDWAAWIDPQGELHVEDSLHAFRDLPALPPAAR